MFLSKWVLPLKKPRPLMFDIHTKVKILLIQVNICKISHNESFYHFIILSFYHRTRNVNVRKVSKCRCFCCTPNKDQSELFYLFMVESLEKSVKIMFVYNFKKFCSS